ncbi:MAG: hypothetical protein J6P60_00005, partial [Lachnospiraceae bacterium]|nr:hypothetical protein [Lachnospiraceae bacterium]
ELATVEDKQDRIDHWASLFKATTWEEIRMIAKENEAFTQAAETIYQLSAEEEIRQRCQAREDYYRRQNGYKQKIEDLTAENESLTTENESLTTENESLTAEVKDLSSENESLSAQNNSLSAENERLLALLKQNGISV